MFSVQFLLVAAIYYYSISSVSANCIHGTHLHRRQVSEEGTVQVSNFGYSDLEGPLNWAALDPANDACATSSVQSPIVIDDSIPKAEEPPIINFPNVEEAEFENLGTTLEVIVEGTTTVAGTEFKLQQFHFHTPSEHRINDEFFPVEMHMVHEAEDGTIAVIAIPFQLTEDGSSLELLDRVIENIQDIREPGTITTTGPLDFTQLTEAIQTRDLFQYTGSLTTPPCAEGLIFLVMEEPMDISVRVFNALKSVIKFNARYSQNKLGDANLIQVGSQVAQLNCDVVEVSGSAAVELQANNAEVVEEDVVEEEVVNEDEEEIVNEDDEEVVEDEGEIVNEDDDEEVVNEDEDEVVNEGEEEEVVNEDEDEEEEEVINEDEAEEVINEDEEYNEHGDKQEKEEEKYRVNNNNYYNHNNGYQQKQQKHQGEAQILSHEDLIKAALGGGGFKFAPPSSIHHGKRMMRRRGSTTTAVAAATSLVT